MRLPAVSGHMVSVAQSEAARPLEQATPEELIERLAPATGRVSSRGLRNIAPARRQIDLTVNFDFASDSLQPQSIPLLQSLAAAMTHPRLQGARFMIEGHTDARGGARFNEELSIRRARAVMMFLRGEGVAADRLTAEGRGFNELLNPGQPDAAENRRVRVISLSP